ncbi:MAG: squalene synthase HpnC, partial [Dehalococcoidia bacterium]
PRNDLEAAYALCTRLANSHYENFGVVSWLLPHSLRQPMYALYAFCRHTDDLGDEATGDRLALLDAWEQDLGQCYEGTPQHPILVALQDVVDRFGIPETPFRKLVQANRMDQGRVRFATYADLLRYCDHSANPVGHMVLYLTRYASPDNMEKSDATCTALQLANFWQDVQRDHAKDRIYLPMEDMARSGYAEADLAAGRVNDEFRTLMRFEVERTQALFERGLPLLDRVHGRFRLDLALFSKGGMRVLDAIREQDYDVLSKRPVVSGRRKLWLTVSTAARLALLGRP